MNKARHTLLLLLIPTLVWGTTFYFDEESYYDRYPTYENWLHFHPTRDVVTCPYDPGQWMYGGFGVIAPLALTLNTNNLPQTLPFPPNTSSWTLPYWLFPTQGVQQYANITAHPFTILTCPCVDPPLCTDYDCFYVNGIKWEWDIWFFRAPTTRFGLPCSPGQCLFEPYRCGCEFYRFRQNANLTGLATITHGWHLGSFNQTCLTEKEGYFICDPQGLHNAPCTIPLQSVLP